MSLTDSFDSGQSSDSYRDARPSRSKQYLATLAASLGAMAMGAVAGFTSPAEALLQSWHDPPYLPLTQDQVNWFSSAPFLGASLGGIVGGVAVNWAGRKGTMMATALVYAVGWVLVAASQNFGMMLAGRLMTGVCIGTTTTATPTYIAEIASPDIRGTLGSAFQLINTVGVFFGLSLGTFVTNWRWMAAICLSPSLLQLVLLFFIKESPVFLLSKGKTMAAVESLKFFRGEHHDVQREVMEVLQDQEAQKNRASVLDLLKPHNLKPLLLVIAVFFLTLASGIVPVMSNLSEIFKASGTSLDDNISAMIVGFVSVVATVGAVLVVDWAGRKVLLVISASAMAFAHVALAEYFGVQGHNSEWTQQHLSWLPLAALIVYIVAFSIGFGPVSWLLMSEVLPPSVREMGSGLAVMFFWLGNFGITYGFIPLQDALGLPGLYLMLAGMCVLGLAFSAWVVPETKGLTLHQISEYFS